MSKKIISLIQAIIQSIAIAFLFIPGTFRQYVFMSKNNGSRPTTKYFQNSAFEAADISNKMIWVILLVAFFAISLAYFILWFATTLPILRKRFAIAVPCIPIVFIVLSTVMITSYKYSTYSYYSGTYSMNYKLSWGFYVVCVLYLAVVCLEIYKHFAQLPDRSEHKPAAKSEKAEGIAFDDLEKMKELMDQGIITEEEFNAKKKQILGL